jgi:hypothetical protein
VYKTFGIEKDLADVNPQGQFFYSAFAIGCCPKTNSVPGQALFDFLGQRNLSFESSRKSRQNWYFANKSRICEASGTKKDLAEFLPQGQFFY